MVSLIVAQNIVQKITSVFLGLAHLIGLGSSQHYRDSHATRTLSMTPKTKKLPLELFGTQSTTQELPL